MPSNDKDHGIASGLGHEAMLQQAQQPTPPAPPAEMTVEKALARMASRVAALEAQIAECQQANTKLITRAVELEHQRDKARALLAAVREVVAASVAMDETRPDALRFLRAVDAHEAATRALGEDARAWAREDVL